MTLQDRIKEAMRRNPGLSQADIARACKVKTPSVTDWLNGDTKTLRAETARLAGLLFGCDPHWLATGVGAPGWRKHGEAPTPGQEPAAGLLDTRLHMLGELFDWIPRLPGDELSLIYTAVKNAVESAAVPMPAPNLDLSWQPAADPARLPR